MNRLIEYFRILLHKSYNKLIYLQVTARPGEQQQVVRVKGQAFCNHEAGGGGSGVKSAL